MSTSSFTDPVSGWVGSYQETLHIHRGGYSTKVVGKGSASRKKRQRRKATLKKDKTSTFKAMNNEMTSVQERVEKWYLRPLLGLTSPHDGFAILTLSFPLLERYLRSDLELTDQEKFSEGHQAFKTLAEVFSCTPKEAYLFWQNYRNGLLHRATQTDKSGMYCALTREGQSCVWSDGDQLWVNPINIRGKVIELVKSSKLWTDPEHPIAAETYVTKK